MTWSRSAVVTICSKDFTIMDDDLRSLNLEISRLDSDMKSMKYNRGDNDSIVCISKPHACLGCFDHEIKEFGYLLFNYINRGNVELFIIRGIESNRYGYRASNIGVKFLPSEYVESRYRQEVIDPDVNMFVKS